MKFGRILEVRISYGTDFKYVVDSMDSRTRIGPILEVTTSYMYGKHGIEIRIESVNQDNSHSWVRISYGTVKYVVDSIQDNTEIPADPQEERVPQTSIKVVAGRQVKGKSKTTTESTRWYNSNHTNT